MSHPQDIDVVVRQVELSDDSELVEVNDFALLDEVHCERSLDGESIQELLQSLNHFADHLLVC